MLGLTQFGKHSFNKIKDQAIDRNNQIEVFDAQNVILALRRVYVLQMFRTVTSNTLTS